MRRFLLLTSLLLSITIAAISQSNTACSMYLKKDKTTQLAYIESEKGNLFNKLAHHGPAIENQWYALRIYFNKKTAIDVYSKAKPGLELAEKKWYPTKKEQLEGWGADYYKVGKTIGLGGVKLWDGDKVIDLNPVTKRSASLTNYNDSSCIEMISEGIPYQGKKVNISIRITMYASKREAKIEATSLTEENVQFVTGINYFAELESEKGDDYALTWGVHPEDVAAEKIAVGAAIFMQKDVIEKHIDDGKQYLFITKAVHSFSSRITTYNERENEVNSFDIFKNEIHKLLATQYEESAEK